MTDQQQEMFLFIADISGYTEYMLKNQMDYSHGTLIVLKLLNSLIKEIQVPLEISKLEGDAIFMYLLKDKIPEVYQQNPLLLGQKLIQFFEVFSKALNELEKSSDCACGACSNIEHLNLKVIAHYGRATIDKIGNFQELSGVDVILIHRLLKNKIPSKSYLLLTKPAHEKISFENKKLIESTEEDKDIGKIAVCFCEMPQAGGKPPKGSAWSRFRGHVWLFFGSWLLKLGLIKTLPFKNFPS
jgi:hypothetical protein